MEARVGHTIFTTQAETFSMTRPAAAPHVYREASETAQLTMIMEVHVDDLYATGSGDDLCHTVEHLKHTLALKVQYLGTPRDCAVNEGDALELQPHSKYLEEVRLSPDLDRCNTAV